MPHMIVAVTGKRQLREFVQLPARIHNGHKRWVPGIFQDDLDYLDPACNRFSVNSETVLYMAYQNKKPVGRIMGLINRRYNETQHEKIARFTLFDCIEDVEIARSLLQAVEGWAADRGMERVVGPKGFSNLDPQGILIEGFEFEPTMSAFYNFEYIPKYMEACGYSKQVDYVNYHILVPQEMPAVYEKVYTRISHRRGIRLIEFNDKKKLQPYILPVFRLMNDAYRNIHGFLAFDDDEIRSISNKFMPVINPNFVKVVEKEGEVMAFVLGIPNMNDGFRKARGRLFPFGFLHILRSAKSSKKLDLLLGAIKDECRGQGLDVLMGVAMIHSARELGIQYIDSNQELEQNHKVRAEMERVGGKVFKRSRIYQKEL